LRREHITLLEAKADWGLRLQEQQVRCRDVQLLKFGQEIDTALLDSIGLRNHAAEELKAALQHQVWRLGAGLRITASRAPLALVHG
jgi:hypothetical protein